MMDLIIPYPEEDEVSFIKRKAYYYRMVKPRLDAGPVWIERKKNNMTPIDALDKELIADFWNQFLPSDLIDTFIDFRFYDFYNSVLKEGEQLAYYIPDSFNQPFIDEYYSNPQHSFPFDDKNLYDLYFHDVNCPKVVFRKVNGFFLDENYSEISIDDAIKKAKDSGEIILKPAKFSMGGSGILIWNADDEESKLVDYLNGLNFIVCQEIIKQHPEMAKVNPSSVNTLRIMTLILNGQVHVLSSVCRMGVNGSRIDNASKGGIVCGIKSNGQLKDVAFTPSGDKYMVHPQGVHFESITIPHYAQCVDLVKSLAKRFAAVSRLISWDLAIDESGQPMLIEFNLTIGEMDFHQLCNGPLYGDLTEEVLKDVFANSYTLNSIIKSFR